MAGLTQIGVKIVADGAREAAQGMDDVAAAAGRMAQGFGPLGTIVATAAAAIAATLGQIRAGAAEMSEYRRALAMTGNAVGKTADELNDLARALRGTVGSQAAAADALANFAASGAVLGVELGKAAEAAVRLERVGGPAVRDTVAAFQQLAKDPLKASVRINETTNFLTESLYRQIKALTEQGDAMGAARVAQEAFASESISRAKEIKANLGAVERAWNGIKGAIESAKDAVMSFGRSNSDAELEAVRLRIRQLQARQSGGRLGANTITDFVSSDASVAKELQEMQALERHMRDAAATSQMLAKEQGRRAEATKAAIAADKAAANALAAQKREAEAAARVAAQEQRRVAAVLAELSGVTASYAEDLGRLQRMRAAGVLTEERYAQAVGKLIAKQPFAVSLAREQAQAEQALARARDEGLRAQEKYLAGLSKQQSDADRQLQQLRDEITLVRDGETAREKLTQARLDEAAAAGEQAYAQAFLSGVVGEELERLRVLAERLREVAAARRELAQAKTDAEAERELGRVVDEARKESERWMSDMQRGLTDVFRQSFLAGGNFGKAFARGLAAEVQARLATALASVLAEAVLGAGLRAATGGSGAAMTWLQGANTASSLYGVASGYSASVNALAGMLGAGSTAGAAAGSLAYANAVGAMGGDSLGAFIAANNSWGGVAAGSSTAAGSSAAAGASLGAYAGYAALIYAAAMHQSSLYDKGFTGLDQMSGKFLFDISVEALGAKLLKGLGMSDKWSNILSGAVAFNYLFGRAAPKITEQGITGVLSGGDFEGSAYANWKSKGGLFRSDKKGTILADLPDELARFLDDAAASVRNSVAQYGQALGLPADELDRITRQIKIALTDDAEANMQAIAKEMGSYGDALVESWAAAVAPLANYGETTAQTIARVGSAIVGVNDVLEALGKAALQASIDGGQAALMLQQYFGGLENMQQAAGSYLQNYYSDEERRSLLLGRMGGVLGDVGIGEVPQTREAFRALVDSLDLTTDSGQRAFAVLMGVADAFAAVVPAAEDASAALAQAAAKIASERDALQVKIWQEKGDEAALRAWDRAQVAPENLDLFDELMALRDAKAAAEAAQAWTEVRDTAMDAAAQAASAWERASASITEEVMRLRGELGGDSSVSGLVGLAAEFATATAQARAGDVDAATRLPTLSRALSQAWEAQAASQVDADLYNARLAVSLERTAQAGGQGASGGGGGASFVEDALLTIARNTRQTAEALDDAARGRLPLSTKT